jgi:hypothetical protein
VSHWWSCCQESLVPDDTCPICSEFGLWEYLQVEIPQFPCAQSYCTGFPGTWILEYMTPIWDEGYTEIIGCSWLWASSGSFNIVGQILKTGLIRVGLYINYTYRFFYSTTYFTGDPPFDCRSLRGLELPLQSASPSDACCVDEGHSVYVSFVTGP